MRPPDFWRESERWHRRVAREEAMFRFFVFVFGIIAPVVLLVLMVLHYAHIQP